MRAGGCPLVVVVVVPVLCFFFADVVVVLFVVVVAELSLEPPLPEPEFETIAIRAITNTINASGARKRAGLLLVRFLMAGGW